MWNALERSPFPSVWAGEDRRRRPRLHAIIILAALMVGCPLLGPPFVSADSARPAGIIAMCKGGAEGRIEVVRGWLLSEPSFRGIVIPARTGMQLSTDDVWRMIRVYFPRTYSRLTGYDFILLASVDMQFFTDRQIRWMYDAIAKDGLGAMNTRSVQSMSIAWSGSWMNSILSDAFPNDVPAVVNTGYYQSEVFAFGPLIVNDDQGIAPVVRPFRKQIESLFRGYGGVVTVPRRGSTIYTWIRTDLTQLGDPRPGYVAHLFSWKYANATTFTAMDMVMEDFWKEDRNPFSLDIMANVVWHSTDRKLPDDAMRVHALRTLFRSFQLRKSILVSMFDFAERFGASTSNIYSELGEVEKKKAQADAMYLGGDFSGSEERMNSLLQDLGRLEEEAVKIKNRALAWVYFIEWLTVSATLLMSGVVLWQLMVGRRAYREVTVSRYH